jgi:hypothetical protein
MVENRSIELRYCWKEAKQFPSSVDLGIQIAKMLFFWNMMYFSKFHLEFVQVIDPMIDNDTFTGLVGVTKAVQSSTTSIQSNVVSVQSNRIIGKLPG